MIWFALIAASYVAALLFVSPAPASLRAAKSTPYQNFLQTKVALTFGVFLLVVFFATSSPGLLEMDEGVFRAFTLRVDAGGQGFWPWTILTHLFLHANLVHLLVNVSSIGIASVYERRVGAQRFALVLTISSIASIASVMFYPSGFAFCGISGGVSGLAAAYFTDQQEMTFKEWAQSIGLFALIFGLISISGAYEMSKDKSPTFQVDHVGHVLGALAAILYCRMVPRNG